MCSERVVIVHTSSIHQIELLRHVEIVLGIQNIVIGSMRIATELVRHQLVTEELGSPDQGIARRKGVVILGTRRMLGVTVIQ